MDSFHIPLGMVDFHSSIRTPQFLKVTAADLGHALFVTGRAPGDQSRHGLNSVYEYLHRASIVPAYLRQGPDNRMLRTSLALSLDKSEKSVLSYFLGQAMTGIFCTSVLDTDWPLHIDRYAASSRIIFQKGNLRPDLFARSDKGWVVAEAKGRSAKPAKADREEFRKQKRSVASISGVPPWQELVSIAHWHREELKVLAIDPEEDEPESIPLVLDEDRFVLAYYLPFLRWFDYVASEVTRGLVVEPTSIAVTVSLDEQLLERIREAEDGNTIGLASDVRVILDDSVTQYSDGSAFEVDWDRQLTRSDYEFDPFGELL